jgi:hypothetical protein
MDEPVVGSLSKELPTCALDDVNPTDCAVRMEGSLLPTNKTDAVLKYESLKIFFENGQIPEFRNSAYVFSIRNETDYAEVIILVRSWLAIFFGIGHHPVICATAYFVLKGSMTATSRYCR